jgi:hypothetical protein
MRYPAPFLIRNHILLLQSYTANTSEKPSLAPGCIMHIEGLHGQFLAANLSAVRILFCMSNHAKNFDFPSECAHHVLSASNVLKVPFSCAKYADLVVYEPLLVVHLHTILSS